MEKNPAGFHNAHTTALLLQCAVIWEHLNARVLQGDTVQSLLTKATVPQCFL